MVPAVLNLELAKLFWLGVSTGYNDALLLK